jgi:carboxylesterase
MVETCVLDDSYHIVTVDRQRDLVVERTVAFARRIAEPSGLKARSRVSDIAELFGQIA